MCSRTTSLNGMPYQASTPQTILSKRPSNADIDMALCQSDLRFDVREIEQTLSVLKVKNSSGLDKVSNKMVKPLSVRYHGSLTQAYNRLFRSAYWETDWKTARTICLNQSNTPIPTTNQLRPIVMLPVLSKICERLFLLRFNQWSRRMNILPAKQSGARAHQGTQSTRTDYSITNIRYVHPCHLRRFSSSV